MLVNLDRPRRIGFRNRKQIRTSPIRHTHLHIARARTGANLKRTVLYLEQFDVEVHLVPKKLKPDGANGDFSLLPILPIRTAWRWTELPQLKMVRFTEKHKHTAKQSNMTPVGFEPTQLALVELESTPLDHSGKVSHACSKCNL